MIQQSAGIIQNGTEITPDVLDSLRTELEAMELGPLFGLWLQSFLIQLTMIALNIVIFVIVYGRMIEIYLLTSLALSRLPQSPTGKPDTWGRTISAPSLRWLSRSIDLSLCRHLCGADPEYRHRRRPHRGDLGMRGIYGVAVFYLIQNRQSCKIHLRLPLRDFGPC